MIFKQIMHLLIRVRRVCIKPLLMIKNLIRVFIIKELIWL